MSRGKTVQGFTLIEVLLAMTLMSIMMVLLFASLKICAQSWEQGEKKINEVNDVAAAVNFFQRHLTVAKPFWNDFTKEERLFSFQGKKQAVQFVSSFPASAGRSGLQLISVALQRENREQVLTVTLTPFFPLSDGEEWNTEEEVLIKGVRGFSLAYFGPEEGQPDSRWQDEWLQRNSLPKLIKIKIDQVNGIFWPEMVFEFKNASSANTAGLSTDSSDSEDEGDGEQDTDPDGENFNGSGDSE